MKKLGDKNYYDQVRVKNMEFFIDGDGDLEIDFSDYDYGAIIHLNKEEQLKIYNYLKKYLEDLEQETCGFCSSPCNNDHCVTKSK